jgi:hypothetical protein
MSGIRKEEEVHKQRLQGPFGDAARRSRCLVVIRGNRRRSVVERANSWHSRFTGLLVRWESVEAPTTSRRPVRMLAFQREYEFHPRFPNEH